MFKMIKKLFSKPAEGSSKMATKSLPENCSANSNHTNYLNYSNHVSSYTIGELSNLIPPISGITGQPTHESHITYREDLINSGLTPDDLCEKKLSIAYFVRANGRLQLVKEEKEVLAGMRFSFTRYTENDLEEGEIYLYPLDPDDKVWGFYPAEFDKNDLN